MTVRYARSTDGSDADNGTTWALAKATLAGLAAIDTAGDTLWLSQAHAESSASDINLALAGTLASPSKILCGNDGAAPPTALATTATITTTGASSINSGSVSYAYWYGIGFFVGTGSVSQVAFGLAGNHFVDTCTVALVNSHAAAYINLQSGTGKNVYKNCGFKFAASGQGFKVPGTGTSTFARADIVGGSILAGGTSPANLLVSTLAGAIFNVDGFDMSNADAAMNIVASGVNLENIRGTLRNCRLPGSWSGSLHAGTPGLGSVFEMFNCDSADTHYRYRKAAQFGTIQDETTLVRTGGASDGTTTYSLKLVSNGNAEHPMLTLDTPEIVDWNSATGSSINVTVEILHDSATALKDNEIWLEGMYLGTSGVPLASFVSEGISVVATAADQASSSAAWTTTGMSNPNTQKLSFSFTPQEAGHIHVVVKMAKASYTVYVDPMFTVS